MRKNKSKEEIVEDIKRTEKVKQIKETVRKVYPLLEPLDTIYDAQTVCAALAGLIKADVEEKLEKFKLSDVEIDLSKEKDSKIKVQMIALLDLLKDEPAQDLSQVLERLGRAFSDFGSTKFLKNPMSELKIEDILAE
jgi:predicted hydrocarbon binding protein